MKTLEEIKDEYAREIGFDDWNEIIYSHESDEIEHHSIIISKRFSIEVAKEALRNAASKSFEMRYYKDEVKKDILNQTLRVSQCCYAVPKHEILKETNIPKL